MTAFAKRHVVVLGPEEGESFWQPLPVPGRPFAVIASAAKQSPSCIRTKPARDCLAAPAMTGLGDGREPSGSLH